MPLATRGSLLLVPLFVNACAPAAPEPVQMPPQPKPLASTAPPPAPRTEARWTFPDTGGRAEAQIDLGAKGILQVGERGRRWLVGANGEVTQASVLVPQKLVDVQERAGKLFLLGQDGTTYEVNEPLGPIVATHPATETPESLAGHAATKDSLLLLLRDGSLRRSTDGGATWATSKLPLRPGEQATHLAANRRGEVLVLLMPQRVLFSSDDGATFNPLATPGFGAEQLERDGHDDLFLHGYGQEKWAKLSTGPARLQVVKEAPAPLASHVGKQKPNEDEALQRMLAGSRVVTLLTTYDKAGRKSIAASVSALGAKAGAPVEIDANLSRWAPVRVAGHESTIAIAAYDGEADPPVTRIKRTTDDGKTWETIGTFEGREKGNMHLAVGPNWLAIGELCNPKTKECTPPQVKIGNKAWANLDVPAKLLVSDFVFDAAHDRVIAVAMRSGGPVLLEGKLSGGPLAIVDVELPHGSFLTSTIDSKGDVRLITGMPNKLVRVSLGKAPKIEADLYLPFAAHDVSLAGDRGFAHWGEKAWETADGGEHWLEVAPGASGGLQCSAAGCVEAGAVRIGWDINPGDKAPLAATIDLPKHTPKPNGKPQPPPPSTKTVNVACTVAGPWKTIGGQVPRASDATFAGDVRFVTRTWSIFGQPETLWIARGNKAPEKMTLLGPSPKEDDKLAIRTWASESPLGRVSARFAFRYGKTPSGGYNPVDVDLGWYSATRGKSAKVHLAKVAAFRVGRSSPSALTAVVDGGLIFLPYTGDAPLYFVSDAGKITTMPRPPADEWERYDHAVRIGDRIVLAANNFSTVVRLASTSDNGKTWSTTTWSMGEAATLVTHGGKPALVVDDHAGDAVRFVSFDALTPDPPALTLVEAKKLDDATGSLTACDAKSAGFVTDVPASASTPMINVSVSGKTDQDKLEVAYESRVMRIGDGAACVNAIVAGGGNEEVVIFSPSDMAHAWWVRAGKDDGSEARPLTCKGP